MRFVWAWHNFDDLYWENYYTYNPNSFWDKILYLLVLEKYVNCRKYLHFFGLAFLWAPCILILDILKIHWVHVVTILYNFKMTETCTSIHLLSFKACSYNNIVYNYEVDKNTILMIIMLSDENVRKHLY